MTHLTKAQQETALGEGLALGAMILGVDAVNGNKTTLELDFRAAWRAWPHSSKLPAIDAGPSKDSLFPVLRKSVGRSTHHVAEWHGTWPFVPVILQDWTVNELADSIHEDITADSWRDLVKAWMKR